MLANFIKFVVDNALNVDSIIATVDGIRYDHQFVPDTRNNIRSISKVLSCFGIYKAIENQLFDLDSYVMPFFSDFEIHNKSNLAPLSKLKIRHLLNLTMGHETGLLFRKDVKNLPAGTDFISYILNYDIKHEPGTFFVYNNAATYLLCAIVQKIANLYFSDWVYETVLQYLGIEKPKWEKSDQGICLGASGLYLSNEEMHRVGLLLLNGGRYDNARIIDKAWIDTMHTPHFFTAGLDEYAANQTCCINKMAYGYHLWICGDGSQEYPKTHYFCDGTDGQFLIVSPKQKMVLTILSHQEDMNPFYEILNDYIT
ncbi:MAG: beta-lactamase family protein [Synergistaceae bacterium]|jgi:CubicO group peptidase (beta-lactamase class C family)|nr:beta-lactamase family protein [Synergistaceae bacterium]